MVNWGFQAVILGRFLINSEAVGPAHVMILIWIGALLSIAYDDVVLMKWLYSPKATARKAAEKKE